MLIERKTQLEEAREGNITKEMEYVSQQEGLDTDLLRKRVSDGLVVILSSKNHEGIRPVGVGLSLRTKVNANIGTSPAKSSLRMELGKLKVSLEAGADTIMDLSTSGNLDRIRRRIIKDCPVPLGTVPLYQTAIEAGRIEDMNIDLYLEVFEKHAKDGIDFATVHAGVTQKVFPLLEKRVMKCVSRGGSFLLNWMKHHGKENFLYEYYDDILKVAKKYDVTISLGDGLRPGCLADATDEAQIQELKILGELARRAREKGVQVMIEGPGHIPLNDIEKNVMLEKEYCDNAPFYVLGPLPTDIAAGYDHITCAIGGALAAWKGADFICYVTPKEHVGLPDIKDAKEGVIAVRIAAHIADIAKGNKKAMLQDYEMAKARARVDWDDMQRFALDPVRFAQLRAEECRKNPLLKKEKYCSMCGPFCVFKQQK